MEESRLIKTPEGEKYINGYFLTLEQIENIVHAFHGRVSDRYHIKEWIKKHIDNVVD